MSKEICRQNVPLVILYMKKSRLIAIFPKSKKEQH